MKKEGLLILFLLFILKSSIAHDKPNIVYINIDDLGWTDLACYGSTYYETPNIALKQPEQAAKLLQILNTWRIALKAPIPSQLNPKYQASN